MAVFACLLLLVAYSVATSNISTTSAHVTDLPLIQPPTGAPSDHQQDNEVKSHPIPTDLSNNPINSPCGLGRQMPYWPMAPPGPVGAPGPSGSAGIPGLPGAGGAQGARGERGDRGESGLQGVQGFKGDKGELGTLGPRGFDGKPGWNGTEGQKGEPGQSYTPPDMSVFHVQRSTTLQLTSGTQIITFDSEVLNVGDDMSRHTGVFTCRIPGLYYFTFTFRALASGSYGLNINLMTNNVVKANMYMQPFSKDIMQTQSSILRLNTTDEVWIRASPHTYIQADRDSNNFSGFLIKAI